MTTLTLFDISGGNGCPVPDHLKPKPRLAFELAVHGTPAPQGSKKGFYNKHLGRVQMVESSAKVQPWRDAVVQAAVVAWAGQPALDEPLHVDMIFTAIRPRSHYRTGRNAHLLHDNAPAQPTTAPDLSKLARSTEDALTTAQVWRDDALVAEYRRLAKVWAREDPDALDSPGVVIRIHTIGTIGATP